MPSALNHSLPRLPIGTVLLCVALAAGGCGSDSSGSSGGDVSFADSKKGLADLVDATYEAVLSDLDPRRFPENAIPCREGGGAGGATGDYAPNGALGYQGIQLVPSGEAVFAQTNGYRLSFEITPKQGRGKLGGGGPCAKPASEEERKAPPEFRSLKR